MIDYIILRYIGRTLDRTLPKVTHFLGQCARVTAVISISNLLFFWKKNHLIQLPLHDILSLKIRALQVKKSNQTPKSHLCTSDGTCSPLLCESSQYYRKLWPYVSRRTSHTVLLCRWVIRNLANRTWHPQNISPGAGHFLSIHSYYFFSSYFFPEATLIWISTTRISYLLPYGNDKKTFKNQYNYKMILL